MYILNIDAFFIDGKFLDADSKIIHRDEIVNFVCEKCNKDCSIRVKSFTECLCKKCKTIKTNIEKYGVENPFQSELIKTKIKQKELDKYGCHHTQSKEWQKTNSDENYSKFGVKHIVQRKDVIEKSKKSKLEKYGNMNNFKKIKKTKLEKHGDENYNNKEKTKQTMIEKYGGFSFQSKDLSNKIKKTKLEKYGNENYNNRNLAEKTSKERYGVYPYNSFGKENFMKNMLKIYGVSHNMKLEEVKKRVAESNRKRIYNLFLNSDRLKGMVTPLFLIGDYVDSDMKYLWKCNKCQNEFEDKICDGLIPRCEICYPKHVSSIMEKDISNWIKSLNIDVVENTKDIISPLELDIYLPSHNLAIEFNGLYWHSESQGKNFEYHLNKTNTCKEKGIQLIHVFENEWINKQSIVKSIIKSKLYLYDQIISGRQCIVKKITSREANDFYFNSHIQEGCRSSINLGLFHRDELVSCLSFSKSRYNKKYDWEITRFANKLNTKVHGSFGKLWKHKPEGSIITYSDKRLFNGAIYKKYMTQLNDSRPSYWYFKDLNMRNRLEFQKHKLSRMLEFYDSNLNEWENMQLNNWDRIWDCGNHVFEYK